MCCFYQFCLCYWFKKIIRRLRHIVAWKFEITAKRFKQFRPLINVTKILHRTTCVENFVEIDPVALSRSLKRKFCSVIAKLEEKNSIALPVHKLVLWKTHLFDVWFVVWSCMMCIVVTNSVYKWHISNSYVNSIL